jgi:hypothetical protein
LPDREILTPKCGVWGFVEFLNFAEEHGTIIFAFDRYCMNFIFDLGKFVFHGDLTLLVFIQ